MAFSMSSRTNNKPGVCFRRHGELTLWDHDFFPLLDHEYGICSVRFFVER